MDTAALAVIDKPPKPTLHTEDKVYVTTIIPELAAEIGLNESILLRQIAHWIKSSNNLRDGQWWTFQSLQDMRKDAFPYWSISTISRVAKNLVDAGYVERTNRYNKRRNDATFWYALNVEKLATLKSITVVLQNEKGKITNSVKALQNEKSVLQNEKPLVPDVLQNETTLPEVSLPEVSTEVIAPLPEKQTDEKQIAVADAKQLIFVYKSYSKNADESMLGWALADAKNLIKAGITPEHVKHWYAEKSQDPWIKDKLNGVPTWRMLVTEIIAWRDKKKQVDRPALKHYAPPQPLSDADHAAALKNFVKPVTNFKPPVKPIPGLEFDYDDKAG